MAKARGRSLTAQWQLSSCGSLLPQRSRRAKEAPCTPITHALHLQPAALLPTLTVSQEGSRYYGPHVGRGTQAGSCYHWAQAALQAPGQIPHSPSTAGAELSNASHLGIPTVLWKRVITLQNAISPITSRIYIFLFYFIFFNLISSNFSALGYKNTALQRHITNSDCL